MAGTKRHGTLGAFMSRTEIIGGFLYFPLYVVGLGWLLPVIFRALGLTLSAATVNIIYFIINFLVVALIFRRFLIASLGGIGKKFWPFVQAVILGFVFYYALAWLLSWILSLLHWTVNNPNDQLIASLAGRSFYLMLIGTVLLAPLAEETLFRGLIFGNLHQKSRILAYAISALLFAAIHVWQYVGQVGWSNTLLCAVQYLPAGVALGWTYEKSDCIWAPIIVHCMINAVSMGVLRSWF